MDKIYLDSAASSKPDDAVIEDIIKSIKEDWHNPSSPYSSAHDVRQKIDRAKGQILNLINGRDKDKIIFTSCGTESNNLGIQGFLKSHSEYELLMDQTNHPSVDNVPIDHIVLPIDYEGRIKYYDDDLGYILSETARCDKKPFVVCTMVNNEIGAINYIEGISYQVHKYDGILFVDCCQAIAHMPIDVQSMGIDMLSFTSEKIGCPRGVGVLYIRDGISVKPIMYGGSQNDDIRAGTENQYMITAVGNRCEYLNEYLVDIMIREAIIEQKMCKAIENVCREVCLYHYNIQKSVYNILSVRFDGYNNQQLLALFDENGVECSAGSACSSGEAKPSRILKAIGLSDEEANNTLRFSFDYRLTDEEIDRFEKILRKCLIALKR